ncbi:MAG TPA: hypothetical protein VE136_18265 [Anaerolineales bacterium]|nr:hypothetical protein [Anaerolineales bacterium]
MHRKWIWLIVIIFAAAMAWVESVLVLFMRMLIEHLELYRQGPLPASLGLGQTEFIREAATLVMLLAVGWLAGRSWRDRLGYSLLAFGVWDILYYLFLIPLTSWPQSPLDWDLLFLIPLPWWGPVLAPLSLSGVMILFGASLIWSYSRINVIWPSRLIWGLHLLGILLVLYVFMADSIHAVLQGLHATNYRPPSQFDWRLFVLALGMIASPVIAMLRQFWPPASNRFFHHETTSSGGMS